MILFTVSNKKSNSSKWVMLTEGAVIALLYLYPLNLQTVYLLQVIA